MCPPPESVWDYPRPPRLEHAPLRATVELAGQVLVDTEDVVRILETSHPPTIYLPLHAFAAGVVRRSDAPSTTCEYKGRATYLDLVVGDRVARAAAWTYERPMPGYEALAGRACTYPSRVDRCTLGGEVVLPQEGDFYGGWITSAVAGPFKGGRGTIGW